MPREEGGSLLQPFLELQLSYHTGSPYCNLETANGRGAGGGGGGHLRQTLLVSSPSCVEHTHLQRREPDGSARRGRPQPAEDRYFRGQTTSQGVRRLWSKEGPG